MPPRRKIHPYGIHPLRGTAGEPLLVDLLAVDAAREPVQHARPLRQRAHDPGADALVVVGQIELGLAPGREIHAVRIGDPHRSACDHEFYGFAHCINAIGRARQPSLTETTL